MVEKNGGHCDPPRERLLYFTIKLCHTLMKRVHQFCDSKEDLIPWGVINLLSLNNNNRGGGSRNTSFIRNRSAVLLIK